MSSLNLNSVPQSVLNPELTNPTPTTQVEQPTKEVTPETPKIETESEKLTSTRFAHLSKKEAALVKEREAFKKERESFAQEREAFKSKQEQTDKLLSFANEIKDLQVKDPIAAMKMAGFSETDIYNFMASTEDTSTPEEKAVKAAQSEIEKFKSEQQKVLEESQKKELEAQKAVEGKRLAKFKEDIGKHIASDLDKYEYINFHGESAQETIYETIASILEDSGEMISIEEAAQLVENHYEETDKAMNSLKKRGFKPAEIKEVVEQPVHSDAELVKKALEAKSHNRVPAKQFEDNRIPVKTLTNRLTPSLTNSQADLTPEQNRQRVIEKFKQLNRK